MADQQFKCEVDDATVAERLRDLRVSLNLEPHVVRQRTGISPQRLEKIESGKGELTLREVGLLAAAYDYKPSGLVGRLTRPDRNGGSE
jgi:transcriptional regulator with XRE-family HTH domain